MRTTLPHLLILLLCLVALAGAYGARHTIGVWYLTAELSSFTYTPVHEASAEETYPALLRARYATLTRLDPFFSMEGVEPDVLAARIARLRKASDALFALYTPDEQRLLQHLYPFSFLESLPPLENARRVFIKNPTDENLATYNQALRHTARTYQEALDALSSAYVALPPLHENTYLHSLGGYTTPTHTIQTLEAIAADAARTARAIEDRIACSNAIFGCTPYIPAVAPPRATAPQNETMHIRSLLEAYHTQNDPIANTAALLLPSVRLAQSSCTYTGGSEFALFWRSAEEDARALQLEGLDDVYFFDLRTDRPYPPFLQTMRALGTPLIFQSQTNAYMCLDIGYDIARTATTLAIVALIEPAQAHYQGPAAILNESEVISLLQKKRGELAALGEVQFAHTYGIDALEKLERALRLEKDRSALFAETITHLIWTTDNAAHRMHTRGSITPLRELFFTRAHTSILFLLPNKSILPSAHRFVIPEPQNPQALEGMLLVSYKSALASMYSDADIVALMLQGFDAHQTLALPRQLLSL